MLERLFPRQADNRFEGHRAALWVLGLLIALKLVVSVNSILNTANVAAGADGIPLDSFGPAAAREVLLLFQLSAIGTLMAALSALVILVRYRALVPFIYLLGVAEQVLRRIVVESQAVGRAETSAVAWYITYGVLALLLLGFLLSLLRARQGELTRSAA